MGPELCTIQKLRMVIRRMIKPIEMGIARKERAHRASNFTETGNSKWDEEELQLREVKKNIFIGILLGAPIPLLAIKFNFICLLCWSKNCKELQSCPRRSSYRVYTISVRTS